MPKLKDFLTPKIKEGSTSKKKWDFSDLNTLSPTSTNTSQRRPGRGADTQKPTVKSSIKLTPNQHQSDIKVAPNLHQSDIDDVSVGQESDITTSITSDIKVASNLHQSSIKVTSQPTSQPASSSLEEEDILNINKSSSSGTVGKQNLLPEDWAAIDFSQLSELSVPFGQNHLRQVFEHRRISAQELQESIFHYSYDLRVTPGRKNAIQNHLGYFLNSLKNGPYAPPKGYKSPAEIAREDYLKGKKEEAERLEKFKSDLFETEYIIWWNKLSSDEQKKITIFDGMRGRVEAQRAFKDTIWPTKVKELSL